MHLNRLQCLQRLRRLTLENPDPARCTMSLNDTPQARPTLEQLFDEHFEPVYAYLARKSSTAKRKTSRRKTTAAKSYTFPRSNTSKGRTTRRYRRAA